jgi:hypothetical protein
MKELICASIKWKKFSTLTTMLDVQLRVKITITTLMDQKAV